MKTITDGMAVAQEIARRMSSGAKVSQSDESLIDQFNERHANDRKDWTTELDQSIQSINQSRETGETVTAGSIDISI